ncbi:MAG TPA: hypothetical protein VD758_00520 [Gemmatimonadaceae bacterium]|nr:hypothetical protein [Gemmatimonadaceae bacterium]
MKAMRWLLAAIVTVVSLAAMARISAARVRIDDSDSARLRLSWSARPERIETCRVLSKKELEETEEHMRQRVECEGKFATYALDVFVDGRLVHRSVVRGAGLRHDRPIYLLREIPVPSGIHRIRVSFNRREKTDNDAAAFEKEASTERDTGLFAGRAQREAVEHARRARAAIPAQLTLDRSLSFERGKVVIVTFGAERGSLELLNAE